MANIINSLAELTGKTPLLRLNEYEKKYNVNAAIISKLEYLNPAGSIKDRTALAMIEDAEKNGRLNPGSVIIEPTSGNTGIGLASAAAARGYRVILTMPETMSIERRKLMSLYGAEIILTEGASGMRGAIEKAKELAVITPFSFIPGQFENPANPKIHRETTGPEIWNGTGGKIDFFVSGVGTGGTITGAGGYLKSKNSALEIIAVEPFDSPVLSNGKAGLHQLQGIGAGFIPEVLDVKIYDEIIKVKNEDALQTVKNLARTEGLLAGISSGAALWAVTQIALRHENKDKTIIVIFPDAGERYLSAF